MVWNYTVWQLSSAVDGCSQLWLPAHAYPADTEVQRFRVSSAYFSRFFGTRPQLVAPVNRRSRLTHGVNIHSFIRLYHSY